jgi:hypothetical protein
MAPVTLSALSKCVATLTASWPVARIEHQQDFFGGHQVLETDEFLHQRFIDLKAAGRVEHALCYARRSEGTDPWPPGRF